MHSKSPTFVMRSIFTTCAPCFLGIFYCRRQSETDSNRHSLAAGCNFCSLQLPASMMLPLIYVFRLMWTPATVLSIFGLSTYLLSTRSSPAI
ncbi:hypothetical protein F5878DRAFT_614925 [Lentinula raphanica]|uniref:Uncharacterized protein n=1 Tax=Lentinula raphanica TaxID=153919 RepID=A0AA38UIR8_9AGAR|nr:hypothetical protein F5878DRAFT_614925 [Lentinula raphanica]